MAENRCELTARWEGFALDASLSYLGEGAGNSLKRLGTLSFVFTLSAAGLNPHTRPTPKICLL